MHTTATPHPVRFDVDYPDRQLNRTTTAFRLVAALPVVALLAAVSGGGAGRNAALASGGVLCLGPALMLLFRGTYPRWWFDFNLELERFTNRVVAYVALLDDRYPSATDEQSVHLAYPEPRELSRWKPLVKWILAIPHVVVLVPMFAGAVVATVVAWFSILLTGRYPRAIFDYVTGVLRWANRVTGYALTLVTDDYPPFSLR